MIRTLMACLGLVMLCSTLTACGGGSDPSAAGRDKGPRPAPAQPTAAPGSSLTLESRNDPGGAPAAPAGGGNSTSN